MINKLNDKEFEIFINNFRNKLNKLGFKNTIQKDYILKVLFFSEDHLNAEEITKTVQKKFNLNIGIATVYRALSFLEQMEVINSLDIGDGIKRYELNFNKTHHDHLVCVKCKKVIEFNDNFIELEQIKIAENNGFILNDHIMTIYGLCEECNNK